MLVQNPTQEIRMPLLSVWTRPQATVRYLLARGGWAWAPLLFAVLDALALLWDGMLSNWPLHWFGLVVFGGVVGPLELFILAGWLKLTGKMLFGKASFRELCVALSWALIPVVVAHICMTVPSALSNDFLKFAKRYIVITDISVSGNTAGETLAAGSGKALYAALLIAGIVLTLWGIWLLFRTIGAVQKFGWFRSLLNILLGCGLSLLIAVGNRFFLWQPFSVPSVSMAPTLQPGDSFLGDKLAYGYGRYSFPLKLVEEGRLWGARPARGDMIVFRSKGGEDYVKRVIGLPNDEVQMVNGALHINGMAVKLTFLREDKLKEVGSPTKTARVYRETLPSGVSYEIYDLSLSGADNTQAFHVPGGYYFVLGDNRDNSIDSRFPQVGHVAYEEIIANVGMIYFSTSTPKPGSILHAFDNINWKRMFRYP
jgi:signal peptidase I